jgi:Flp pilus assembly protein TadG
MQSILGRFKIRILKAQREEKGAAMIEFAIIALPFLGLLFGMLEVGLIFWGGYELDNATLAASRQIKTGQAQNSKPPLVASDIKAAICDNVAILSDCASSLTLTVQTVSSFACVADSSCAKPSGLGKGSEIVLVTAAYDWSLFNHRLITSTAVFQNEPF